MPTQLPRNSLQKLFFFSPIILRIPSLPTVRTMTHKDITQVLLSAIRSKLMRECLTNLNLYFYNRKHETQIRDQLSIILNQEHDFLALTEYPKKGADSASKGGAVDMSILSKDQAIATIELKHQYPNDMTNIGNVITPIISDFIKCVIHPTSHVILILQQRQVIKDLPLPNTIKYLEKKDFSIDERLSHLEKDSRFPKNISARDISTIEVQSDHILSAYHFVIYTL